MKYCPTCKKTYPEDDINFCLADGAALLKKRGAVSAKNSRTNEIVAVVLLFLALLTFLCLVSSSPDDRVLFLSTGFDDAHRTQNWIGVVGATISAVLFSLMGLTAYSVPVLLAIIAWRVYYSESLRPRTGRVIGFVLFIASLSGLLSLGGWHGGIVGALFSGNASYLLNTLGAAILMFACFTASILLITNFSFDWLMSHFEEAWGNVKIKLDERKQKFLDQRQERKKISKELRIKNRELKLEAKSAEPPTLVVGETAVVKAPETVAAAMAAKAGAGSAPAESLLDKQHVPTITPPDRKAKAAVTSELGSSELLALDVDGRPPVGSRPATGPLDTSDDDTATEENEPLGAADDADYEEYKLPGSELLTASDPRIEQQEDELLATANALALTTKEFNVSGKVVNISPGPVVTTYEFKPDAGVKYSRVTGLVDDLCLALKAESIRIDRIPGKAFVGIEVPNKNRETIRLRKVIESSEFTDSTSLLSIALGKRIDGRNYVADLAKMPHLLIAGATGAGKSVGVNSLVVSILYKAKPDEVKFIMVDPKRLELGLYADIPHLATPIITDPKRAAVSLKWAVSEMERRYKYLAGFGVRNIDGYNAEAKRRNSIGHLDDNGEEYQNLPFIVIIIDELADLMMVSGKEVEESITRLAQMARAVGIHLVLATQRPSVDVITGLIKANFPARISFRVSSKVDSRTIIDGNGAEGLLGKGDMLFLPPASSQVIRVHGAYVDENEISEIVKHIKGQVQGPVVYDDTITKTEEELDESTDLPGRRDPLFWEAVKSVVQAKRASTSLLQRHLRIGYGRAAAILDAMVREGYIGDMDGSTRARPVLQKAYEDLQDVSEMSDN